MKSVKCKCDGESQVRRSVYINAFLISFVLNLFFIKYISPPLGFDLSTKVGFFSNLGVVLILYLFFFFVFGLALSLVGLVLLKWSFLEVDLNEV